MAVADLVERSDHVGRELAGLLQHGVDQVLGEIAVETLLDGAAQPGCVLEGEGNIGDRRPVAHGSSFFGLSRTRKSLRRRTALA